MADDDDPDVDDDLDEEQLDELDDDSGEADELDDDGYALARRARNEAIYLGVVSEWLRR